MQLSFTGCTFMGLFTELELPCNLEPRLLRRYETLVKEHTIVNPSNAPGVKALANHQQAWSFTQAAWRFFNNDNVTFPMLAEPLFALAREAATTSNSSFLLVAHDWCRCNFRKHNSKLDKTQMSHALDVGYELQASMTTIYALPMVGQEVFVFTHFVVREDAQLLYAFADESERILFRKLIKISGVGPKLALTILSGMNVASFVHCIETRDVNRLVSLPGVGKKTAERLVVEMADKLNKDFNNMQQNFSEVILDNTHDAESALISLGYKPQEAQTVIRKVYVAGADSETLIRLALQSMVK